MKQRARKLNGKLIDAHFKIKKGLSRKETNMFVKDWLKKLAGSYSLIAQIISVPDELVNIIATPFFEGLILGKIDRNL